MPAQGFGVHLAARSAGDPATSPVPSLSLMLADGVRVEQLGFDAVWLPDHFFFQRGDATEPDTLPEIWTLLTAIGMRTERVSLGTNVIAATFRHPAVMAKMAAALQELSGGRLILGLGAGNQVREHAAFGFDFEHRIGRLKEYLPILTGLLRAETVTQTGRYFAVREASLRSAVPPVPVWLASGGPQMFELTARYASGWNMAGGGLDPAAVRERYAAFAAVCAAAGRDVRDLDVCKMTFLAIAPDAPAATRMAEELAARARLTPAAFRARTLVGTPDEIAAWLRTLGEIGITHHIMQVAESAQWANYTDALELVAREVLPRVRAA
jgi:alkanesulfonate monooxygenase SsuD/methylene tetrahydromethanopterin reductase-like flavin-dependent oxidoreductase (luciferase family)